MAKFNIFGRCCIATACTILGISKSPHHSLLLMQLKWQEACVYSSKYRMQFIVPALIGTTILATLIFMNEAISIVENVVIIGGLFLLLDNCGRPLLEVMKPDIRNLPEYKTKF